MQRYFVDKEQFYPDKVLITGEDVHHITKVLRLKAGDKVICSSGEIDALVKIASFEPDCVTCEIISIINENREPEISITLLQSIPKFDKMDFIVQKSTEIGVAKIIPFTSERTIVQLNDKKATKRLERWQKVAKEAAEQSHRSRIPEVAPVISFKELLTFIDGKFALIAYEQENNQTLFQILNDHLDKKEMVLIIGPEGGFSEREIERAKEAGAISISLGKRILRTETASLVGLSNLLYHFENRMV